MSAQALPPSNMMNFPPPPQSLTVGLPDPSTISKQKDAYSKMLEEQMKQGVAALDAQLRHQQEYLQAQADQQKRQFSMQVDMETRQQEMALQQQYQEQKMSLQQQGQQQKSALEQQSMQLTMEYTQKKAEEEMQKQQYEMERQQQEMQIKMQQEMTKYNVQGNVFGGMMPSLMPGFQTPSGLGGGSVIVQPQSGQTYVYGPNGELIPSGSTQVPQQPQQ